VRDSSYSCRIEWVVPESEYDLIVGQMEASGLDWLLSGSSPFFCVPTSLLCRYKQAVGKCVMDLTHHVRDWNLEEDDQLAVFSYLHLVFKSLITSALTFPLPAGLHVAAGRDRNNFPTTDGICLVTHRLKFTTPADFLAKLKGKRTGRPPKVEDARRKRKAAVPVPVRMDMSVAEMFKLFLQSLLDTLPSPITHKVRDQRPEPVIESFSVLGISTWINNPVFTRSHTEWGERFDWFFHKGEVGPVSLGSLTTQWPKLLYWDIFQEWIQVDDGAKRDGLKCLFMQLEVLPAGRPKGKLWTTQGHDPGIYVVKRTDLQEADKATPSVWSCPSCGKGYRLTKARVKTVAILKHEAKCGE
jgi:hypothetical protein